MKTGVRVIGFIVASVWTIMSCQFMAILWFLGGSKVLGNFMNAIDDIFE